MLRWEFWPNKPLREVHSRVGSAWALPRRAQPGFNASDAAAEEVGREPPELSTPLIHA